MTALCGAHLLRALHTDRQRSFTPETGSEPGYLALKRPLSCALMCGGLSGKERQSCCYLVPTSVPCATDRSNFSTPPAALQRIKDGSCPGPPRAPRAWLPSC